MNGVLKAVCCATMLLLAGCETYYRIPDAGPTARVRFLGTSPDQRVMVTAFTSPQCDKAPTGGIMGVLGSIDKDPLGSVPPGIRESGNTLGMIGYDPRMGSHPIERLIPADRKFVFAAYRIQVHMTERVIERCTMSMMFDPQPGEQYEVLYIEREEFCGLRVSRLQGGPGAAVSRLPEPTAERTPQACPGAF